MSLTLTTHDTAFDDPDPETIAKILASLDGSRHALATLARSELTYLQVTGSVQRGFALEYQEGSLDQHHRSRAANLPLYRVSDVFQRYARGDGAWRQCVDWEHVPHRPAKASWSGTWIGLAVVLALVIAIIWYLRES